MDLVLRVQVSRQCRIVIGKRVVSFLQPQMRVPTPDIELGAERKGRRLGALGAVEISERRCQIAIGDTRAPALDIEVEQLRWILFRLCDLGREIGDLLGSAGLGNAARDAVR